MPRKGMAAKQVLPLRFAQDIIEIRSSKTKSIYIVSNGFCKTFSNFFDKD